MLWLLKKRTSCFIPLHRSGAHHMHSLKRSHKGYVQDLMHSSQSNTLVFRAVNISPLSMPMSVLTQHNVCALICLAPERPKYIFCFYRNLFSTQPIPGLCEPAESAISLHVLFPVPTFCFRSGRNETLMSSTPVEPPLARTSILHACGCSTLECDFKRHTADFPMLCNI